MTASSRQILALNAFDAEAPGALPPATQALVERRRRTFGPTSVLFYDEPLHVVAAEDVWIETADGRRYLDLYNNVPSVGHSNPRVAAAIAAQAAKFNTHTRYLYEITHDYAERLLATFPAGLDRIVFTCTGSESNDLALRIAAAATGARGVIVTEAAYHGNTAAVTEVSPSSRPSAALAPHVRAVPAPAGEGDVGGRFAAAVEEAIASLAREGFGVSALLVDTIFSSDGVFADPPGFLAPAVDAVRAAGGLFIADEVQSGFGRTGAAMWGFQRHGVTPDIATMGKPMGNGFPVAGVVAGADLMARFAADVGYFNTFGGNPVAAAAGLAVLDEIADRGLVANAADVGGHMKSRLEALRGHRPVIHQVRGSGLYLGVTLADADGAPEPAAVTRAINGLRDRGVLIGAAGGRGEALKIRPPLTLAREHADMLVDALEAVLAAG
ncbi:aspartate aminotransferase family protein [Methylopila henanensis]|uniref:Aspartate aminotransferase family protein n=1 Tax=Methylopila henanensis TaxID=873516 RepID=A0ABW4KCW0_9HYPH